MRGSESDSQAAGLRRMWLTVSRMVHEGSGQRVSSSSSPYHEIRATYEMKRSEEGATRSNANSSWLSHSCNYIRCVLNRVFRFRRVDVFGAVCVPESWCKNECVFMKEGERTRWRQRSKTNVQPYEAQQRRNPGNSHANYAHNVKM